MMKWSGKEGATKGNKVDKQRTKQMDGEEEVDR
jgi:hypothetical protein